MDRSPKDKAGKDYWETLWEKVGENEAADLMPPRSHVENIFARLFSSELTPFPNNARLLEIGCGNSHWLPYFARVFGFRVAGIDYSQQGCERVKRLLDRAGVNGDVICADLFDPPPSMKRAFDIVVSLGVAEHFEDTTRTIRAFSTFLADGGRMITSIPNMCGAIGFAQKRLNRGVFDLHVPLGPQHLALAHANAGLKIRRVDRLSAVGFNVVNINGLDQTRRSTTIKKIVRKGLVGLSHLGWMLERNVHLPSTKLLSGYIVCVADSSDLRIKDLEDTPIS